MVSGLINANPVVYEKKERRARSASSCVNDEYATEQIDQQEVFDILLTLITWLIIIVVVVLFDILLDMGGDALNSSSNILMVIFSSSWGSSCALRFTIYKGIENFWYWVIWCKLSFFP